MLERYSKIADKVHAGFVVFSLSYRESHFETWRDAETYFRHQETLESDKRTNYETIFHNDLQKPKLDIDITNDHWDHVVIINDILRSLLTTFLEMEIQLDYKDVQLFNSSGISKGKQKWSYHIVVDSYYHNSNDEALALYNRIISKVNPNYREYVDKSIYKSLQQFRLLGNSKCGEDRFKTRMYEWNYNKTLLTWNKLEPVNEFIKSLVVIRDDRSRYRQLKIEAIEKKSVISQSINVTEIEDMVPDGFEIEKEGDYGYKLKRINESYCEICKRIHENENAYIKIEKDLVILKCYRDLSKRFILGNISIKEQRPEPKAIQSIDKRRLAMQSVKRVITNRSPTTNRYKEDSIFYKYDNDH
jgi:hypothetical protein